MIRQLYFLMSSRRISRFKHLQAAVSTELYRPTVTMCQAALIAAGCAESYRLTSKTKLCADENSRSIPDRPSTARNVMCIASYVLVYNRHTCNMYAVQQDTHVLLDTSSWTCRVVRVLPHTKSANTACKTLLMMDRCGPKHVELTHVMNKLTH